jgi:type III secretion protein V
MDGAMKFVKGDAIAGLLIVVVNLIGGISIGALQKGMPLPQAVSTYSLLTIGDGLLAQIPALLLALCSGAIVTRVTTDQGADLGGDIAAELAGNQRSIGAAGVVVAAIGLVPGFPTVLFIRRRRRASRWTSPWRPRSRAATPPGTSSATSRTSPARRPPPTS